VLITDLSSQMAPGYVRVSIGSREENDIFLDAYEKINA
jgi:histidinol-phosphate/aromatic aminotransferase/cobyric acid decarboxylase-like protein